MWKEIGPMWRKATTTSAPREVALVIQKRIRNNNMKRIVGTWKESTIVVQREATIAQRESTIIVWRESIRGTWKE